MARKRPKALRGQRSLLAAEWSHPPGNSAVTRTRVKPEELFAEQLLALGVETVPQLRFAKSLGRHWRFDFAFPAYLVAVEIEGLVVRRLAGQLVVLGRHASPAGIKEDMCKYNSAVLLGWYVLRFPQTDVKPRRAIDMTLRVLAARGWSGLPHE